MNCQTCGQEWAEFEVTVGDRETRRLCASDALDAVSENIDTLRRYGGEIRVRLIS